jgi:hypothetical protein
MPSRNIIGDPGRVRIEHLAIADQDLAVRARRHPSLVGHHDDRRALLAPQADDQIHDHLASERIERTGRLIRKQHLGLHHQRPGQRNPLCLAARQLPGAPSAEAAELKPVQPRGGFLIGAFALDAVQ